MSEKYGAHYSVLKNECLSYLNEKQKTESIFADLTFGAGGHSLALASLPNVKKVFSVDQDPDAIKNGRERIKEAGLDEKIELIKSNFVHFPQILKDQKFDGILLDLGVSSHHFDTPDRGFSFRFEGPLDMRMDPENKNFETAAEILNTYSAQELERIFREYGEEKLSRRIAQSIVDKRVQKKLEMTSELEDIVFHCYPKAQRFGGKSPATKVFQALRIHVNRELEVLSDVLSQLIPMLEQGGRLAVISFHSLEDRIVKNMFKNFEASLELPCQLVAKKPIVPSEQEILENSRSRSAKLRVIERVEIKRGKNKYPRPQIKE